MALGIILLPAVAAALRARITAGAALLIGLVAGVRLIRHQVRRTSAPWLLGLALLLQLVALLL